MRTEKQKKSESKPTLTEFGYEDHKNNQLKMEPDRMVNYVDLRQTVGYLKENLGKNQENIGIFDRIMKSQKILMENQGNFWKRKLWANL